MLNLRMVLLFSVTLKVKALKLFKSMGLYCDPMTMSLPKTLDS